MTALRGSNNTATPLAGSRPVRQTSLAAQTEQILRDRFHPEDLAPGDQLPPEHHLATEFGISRATVRTAITSLVRRGLVVQRHGVGNFVAAGTLLTNNLTEAEDLNTLIERGGATPHVIFDSVALKPAGSNLASKLEINDGALVLEALKRFTADGEILIYVSNSIPESVLGPKLAAEAAANPQITEPLFDFLEHQAGVATAFQLASLEAQLGSSMNYPEANLANDVPVLLFEEVGYTIENQPIWQSSNWFPPSSMSFELIRRRGGLGQ